MSDEDHESSDSEVDNDQPFASARPHTSNNSGESANHSEDEDLHGFIEEDAGTAAVELPTEFSMNTYQDLMHHFKIICQLFVHLAVRDSDERRSFMEQSLQGSPTFCLTEYFVHQSGRHVLLCALAYSSA